MDVCTSRLHRLLHELNATPCVARAKPDLSSNRHRLAFLFPSPPLLVAKMGAGQSNVAGATKEAVFYPESGKGTVQVRSGACHSARPVPSSPRCRPAGPSRPVKLVMAFDGCGFPLVGWLAQQGLLVRRKLVAAALRPGPPIAERIVGEQRWRRLAKLADPSCSRLLSFVPTMRVCTDSCRHCITPPAQFSPELIAQMADPSNSTAPSPARQSSLECDLPLGPSG